MTSQDQTPVEKRKLPRRRVLKAGRIVNRELGVTFPVSLRNMSEVGARIDVMVTTVAIPRTFKLELPLDGLHVECEVIWRNDIRYGVVFSGPVTDMPKLREQVFGMTRDGVLIPARAEKLKLSHVP
jgi:hypothetical protein